MRWLLDRIGRLIAVYLQSPAPGYEPFTPPDAAALRLIVAQVMPGAVSPVKTAPRLRIINSTGQSGHFLSPHYGDQARAWAALEYRPMLYAEEDVAAHTVDTLELVPAR